MKIVLDVAYDDATPDHFPLTHRRMRTAIKRRIAALLSSGEQGTIGPLVKLVIVGNEWEARDIGAQGKVWEAGEYGK